MYAVLWRALPGPVALKVVWVLALLGLAVWVCFTWVFPAAAEHVPWGENTVDTGAAAWTDGARTAYEMDTGPHRIIVIPEDTA